MNKKLIIVMVAGALVLSGCHKKKQQTEPTTEPAQTEDITPVEEPKTDTVQPVVPPEEPTVVEPVEEPSEQPTVPEDTVPEKVAWTPQYQSAYGKGTVTITYKQKKISSPVVVNYIADSIIVASVQPVFGIEMYRLEAMTDKARLYEKLNRRYVEMTYEEISEQARRTITFPLVEQMVEEVGLTYPIGQDTTLRYSGIKANLKLLQRTIDLPVSAAPISTNGYSRTTLNALLSK